MGDSQPISFLSPPIAIPISDVLRYPGLVDVVHQERCGPRVVLRKLVAAAGRRDASQLFHALVDYLLARVWFRPGDVHFSQDHSHPPIPHPIALLWAEWAERVSIQQKEAEQISGRAPK